MRPRRVVVVVLAACAGCGGPQTLRVPADEATIRAAVERAEPGDLVLISPGVYREAVVVETPRIVLRGLDRNHVILDGGNRLGDGIAVHADGVAVENLTVRRYAVNGVVFAPEYGGARQLQGWRASYVTAASNGLYGVYAFGAEHGRFDHVYASGHPDSGVYVGRCRPCHALVRDSVAERNHVGYEATNASGDVRVEDNVWRSNRVGVEINSLRAEAGFPQRGSRLERNVIAANAARDAPRGSPGFGAGVVINGGSENVVRDNRISDHPSAGIVVLDSPDSAARDNTVRPNALTGNAVDIVEGDARGGWRPLPSPPQVDYRTVPLPGPQASMPGAASAPARPATGTPETGR